MGARHSLFFSALSLSRARVFFSSAPQLCSLTGVGDQLVTSNREPLIEDNVVTRTSLPLSVARSTWPLKMMQSELLTPLSQSLAAFPICSALSSQMCVLACLCCSIRCFCCSVHLFRCPAWLRVMKGDFCALTRQACGLIVPGATAVCRAPPGEK